MTSVASSTPGWRDWLAPAVEPGPGTAPTHEPKRKFQRPDRELFPGSSVEE